MTGRAIWTEVIPQNDRLYGSLPEQSQLALGLLLRRSEEASPTAPWEGVNVLASERKAVALEFASSLSTEPSVRAIRLNDAVDDLKVSVLVDRDDLDLDLRIRERFFEVVSRRLDGAEGEICVYPEDRAPDWVYRGRDLAA